jgi:EAL domain-containing protein (putative c-di-GMP-specific phosphodiesterase class I)
VIGDESALDKSAVRILVVDDDLFMLKLLNRMLHRQGFTNVTLCEGAGVALDLIGGRSEPVNIILCDLNMPGVDGLEFVRGLVARQYAGSLILVSGAEERVLHSAEKLIRAHSIPLLGTLVKPVSMATLAEQLEKWSFPVAAVPRDKTVRDALEVSAAIANGELVNYYQPKVAVSSGQIVGVETLVRWNHPRDGLIMPDQFIGVAEEHGLIDALTHAVSMAALTQSRIWLNKGLKLQVAINVSMDNLTALNFPDDLARQANLFRIMHEAIIIEVTESRLMHDLRAPLEVLTRLRLKGFRLSIDDFGTGHSSLAQLRDLPFDELKVDRGFVHRAWQDKAANAIYGASLNLAKQLEMDIVAEGVEDREDWDFLLRTGCELAQGYFIGRPMPGADLPIWMSDWHERHKVELHSSAGVGS